MPGSTDPLPEMMDVVVIGAGVGGLTAAALLARSGLRVVVFEAESQVGGYLAGFERRGFRFSSSIEWLNQCGPKGFVRTIFGHLGDTPPDCPPLHRIQRFKSDRFDYLLTSDPRQLCAELVRDFPEAESGIRALFRDGEHLARRLELLDARIVGGTTLGGVNRALRGLQMLGWSLPILGYLRTPVEKGLHRYFGTSGGADLFVGHDSLMAVMVSIGWAFSGNFQGCPPGGSQAIATWLGERVSGAGSEVLLNRRVEEVLLDDQGAASGVRLADGLEVKAHYVIAACDSLHLYQRMLPSGTVPEHLQESLARADLYPSSFTLYLGLDCPAAELGFGEEALHLMRSGATRAEHNSGDPQRCTLVVLAPSQRDPSLAPPGKGTLTIHCSADFGYENCWRTEPGLVRGAAYRTLKKEFADILIDRVEAVFAPGLRQHIEVMEAATPVTFWRYTGNARGSFSGVKPTGRNIRAGVAHHQTPVKRLLLGGHCGEYGGGVPMAVKAAANASLIVLHQMNRPEYQALRAVLEVPPQALATAPPVQA